MPGLENPIFTMKKEAKETPTKDFIQIVKKEKKVVASLSHMQRYPDCIHNAAILEWQYDSLSNELFSITKLGKRVVANDKMPAFHVYR